MMKNDVYKAYITVEDFKEECRSLISDYKCPLCNGIYLNPVIDTCEHIFCESCFNIAYAKIKACPIGGKPFETLPIRIALFSSILDKQSVYCRNKKKGCDWSGVFKDLAAHLSIDCSKELVNCISSDCPTQTSRKDINEHILQCPYRKIQCPDCFISLTAKEKQEHETRCMMRKVQCTQGCNQIIERCNIGNHMKNDCLYTLIECPFAKHGCEDKFIKKDMEKVLNETMSKHLMLITKSFEELEKKSNALENKVFIINNEKAQTMEINTNKNSILPTNIERYLVSSNHDMTFIGKKRKAFEENEVISLIEDNSKGNGNINNHNAITDERSHITIEDNYDDDDDDIYSIDDWIETDENSLFDNINIGENIDIFKNRAKYDSIAPTKHKYLLGSQEIETKSKNCITSWYVTLKTESHWIAFGLCDKQRVIFNNLKFTSKKSGFNHGSFVLSSNGTKWNCNCNEENDRPTDMPVIHKGTKLFFQYKPMTQELVISFNDYTTSLTQVYPYKRNRLSLCIIFLHPNDEIEVIDYKSTFYIKSNQS